MIPYTLTVSEAETQNLRNLVKHAQVLHRPILLTAEQTSEPVAVLLESSIFEKLQRKEQQLFHLQLRYLVQQLTALETEWDDQSMRRQFVTSFPANTTLLWKSCPDGAEDLCVTLDLAARRLTLEHLSRQQISALRNCLELLQNGAPGNPEIEQCERRLIESGLPPSVDGSDLLVKSYLDEL